MKKLITVTQSTCGISAGAKKVFSELNKIANLNVKASSCIGLCPLEPTVLIESGDTITVLSHITDSFEDIEAITELYKSEQVNDKLRKRVLYSGAKSKMDEILFKGQKRIVLRNAGWTDPLSIYDYINRGGYSVLKKCFEGKLSADDIIKIIESSGLRGRGGAGFPTVTKWKFLKSQKAEKKFVICNADEGDPGAFMDRSVLEGDPHSVLEGIQIAAFVTGATQGYFYIRAEYPLAITTVHQAILDAKEKNLLFVPFEIREGAGAFVCGEETALIASLEGDRGIPRYRPPYPAEAGLWNFPTNINNVETLAAVPWICANPGEYEKIAYKKSTGTKVFALAGKIKRGGLAEVPFGMKLRDLIYEVGQGILDDKPFKAIQIGGPSGGCLSEASLELPIDYEELAQSGAIVGSGGVVVLDDSTCMVEMAKFFLSFTADESCGKCTFCRVGTRRMLDILNKITNGRASEIDLYSLNELADAVKKLSMCGLGQTAPNPVLTTMKYFEEEYVEHIKDKHCRAKACKDLTVFNVIKDKCIGCMLCNKVCPSGAVLVVERDSDKKKICFIDQAKCIKCGKCFDACKFSSILKC